MFVAVYVRQPVGERSNGDLPGDIFLDNIDRVITPDWD